MRYCNVFYAASSHLIHYHSFMEYEIVYEQESENNWGAYAPDLPGLGVGGRTKEEVEKSIKEGIVLHIERLKHRGQPVPEPSAHLR
jgi:predicted RNase H-like HicB family nuclease